MSAGLALALAGAGAGAALLFLVGYRLLRTDPASHLDAEDLVLLRREQRRRAEGVSPLRRLAAALAPRLRRLLTRRQLEALSTRIEEAGRPGGLTVDGFLERTALWVILVTPLALLLLAVGNVPIALLSLTVPVLMPLGSLAGAQRRRRERIDRDLPDFLDILAVTVSAGVNFRAALVRVAERFKGPLADEVNLTISQIANGLPMRDAFQAMRGRSGSESVGQFVSALLQSQELGAPLAESLNQIAADMRRDSAQRQRRKAAQTAPRVSLVTSVVLLPGALIFIIVGFIVGSDVDFGAFLGG